MVPLFLIGTSYFNYIGRIAFPIFAFQIAQGYVHTKNVNKYLKRLLIFAIISQIPFTLFCNAASISFIPNVIFTLVFGLVGIMAYDKIDKLLGIAITILLGIIASLLKFDYGFYGVIIILFFYIFRDRKVLLVTSFSLATLIKFTYSTLKYAKYGNEIMLQVFQHYAPLCICTILSSVFICLYNGKKGYNSKYLLYLFYPLHLLLIYALSFVI